jgi:hypothetical protein
MAARFSSRRHPGRMGEQERSSVPTSPRRCMKQRHETEKNSCFMVVCCGNFLNVKLLKFCG